MKNLHSEANSYVLFRKRLPYGFMILSAVIYMYTINHHLAIKLPKFLFYISYHPLINFNLLASASL